MSRRRPYAVCSDCGDGIPMGEVVRVQGMYHADCIPEIRTADDRRREREEIERVAQAARERTIEQQRML